MQISEEVVPNWIGSSILLLLLLLLQAMNFVFRRCVKYIPLSLSTRTDFEHTGQVSTSVAVVGCAPYRREAVIKHDHVALVAQLMGAEDVIHAVDLEEFLHYLRSECVSCSSWAERELVPLSVWIRPYQVRHGPFVRDLAKAVYDLDLVYAVNAGRETAVYTEDLVVDDARQGEIVEHVRKVVPDGWVTVLAAALCVEAI